LAIFNLLVTRVNALDVNLREQGGRASRVNRPAEESCQFDHNLGVERRRNWCKGVLRFFAPATNKTAEIDLPCDTTRKWQKWGLIRL